MPKMGMVKENNNIYIIFEFVKDTEDNYLFHYKRTS